MIILICGSRTITDVDWVCAKIKEYIDDLTAMCVKITGFIFGGARGVDRISEGYVIGAHPDIPVEICWANWKLYGKAAGPIRNKIMVTKADRLLALLDSTNQSRGTRSTIKIAKAANLPTKVVDLNGDSFQTKLY